MILEMIVSHFSRYCPPWIGLIVSYLDTGLPLFVLLAGFMIGRHYFPKFLQDRRKTTRRLWGRALQIVAIQYVIIATVNLPLHMMGVEKVGHDEPLWLFTLKSAAFMNQIGIVHILPTFIPLFLVSPLILLLFEKRLAWLLCAASAAFFALGNFSPHVFDVGDPVVFPVVLEQIYFVAGCVWGWATLSTGRLGPRALTGWFAASCAGLLATMTLVHGKFVPGRLVSTHPLNVFGLLYHVPIMTTLALGTIRFWRVIQSIFFYPWVAVLGRHALLAFVLHLYWAKGMLVLNSFAAVSAVANYALILASLAVIVVVLKRYERESGEHRAGWARALDAAFK